MVCYLVAIVYGATARPLMLRSAPKRLVGFNERLRLARLCRCNFSIAVCYIQYFACESVLEVQSASTTWHILISRARPLAAQRCCLVTDCFRHRHTLLCQISQDRIACNLLVSVEGCLESGSSGVQGWRKRNVILRDNSICCAGKTPLFSIGSTLAPTCIIRALPIPLRRGCELACLFCCVYERCAHQTSPQYHPSTILSWCVAGVDGVDPREKFEALSIGEIQHHRADLGTMRIFTLCANLQRAERET